MTVLFAKASFMVAFSVLPLHRDTGHRLCLVVVKIEEEVQHNTEVFVVNNGEAYGLSEMVSC